MSDVGVVEFAEDLRRKEVQLRDHFNATVASIETDRGVATYRLEFMGFSGEIPALERLCDVVQRLEALPEVESVEGGIDTDGIYNPNVNEPDESPAIWVYATIEFND